MAEYDATRSPAAAERCSSRFAQGESCAAARRRPRAEKYLRQRSMHRLPHRFTFQLSQGNRSFGPALVGDWSAGVVMRAMRFAIVPLLLASSLLAQTALQKQIRTIAVDAGGKVAVACSLPESDLNCDLEAHSRPPMQSVFKFPLAVYALHLVEAGKFALDQPIRFLPSDRILPETYSPLQDKYPHGDVDLPLQELLRLATSLSDNAAADTVLRVAGGPRAVDG